MTLYTTRPQASAEFDQPSLISDTAWAELRAWYCVNGRHGLPWRHADSPWDVLLAEVLLHRTRSTTVAALFPGLAEEFPEPAIVVEEREKWLEMTYSAGLFWRAEMFVETCAALVEVYGGSVPSEEDALLELPGVGPYITSAVRCFGFGIPSVIVDTNTMRLAGRLAGRLIDEVRRRSAPVRRLVAALGMGGLPPNEKDNYAVLDLSGLVCLPRSPRCNQCPLLGECETGQRLSLG